MGSRASPCEATHLVEGPVPHLCRIRVAEPVVESLGEDLEVVTVEARVDVEGYP
jgi:hypothetical protein